MVHVPTVNWSKLAISHEITMRRFISSDSKVISKRLMLPHRVRLLLTEKYKKNINTKKQANNQKKNGKLGPT